MEINVKKLKKSFGEHHVLNGLELDLKDVHCLVIIGPSGGGKSTFLRILAGLETADSGDVIVNGETISKDEIKLHEYRKKIGVVFQAYNLFPHMSALENIIFPMIKVHKVDESEAIRRAEELLIRFGLLDHKDKYPHQLSGGQQQRVAIVRAMALEPKYLLFDEPTSALDPAITREILDAIVELRKEKKDMVLITHEMKFAENVADYVIYIDNGKIMEKGKPKEFFNNPKSEELKSFLRL